MMSEHELKVWPLFFEAIADGRKTFELRDNTDRWFHEGDRLILNEWDPDAERYTEGRRGNSPERRRTGTD